MSNEGDPRALPDQPVTLAGRILGALPNLSRKQKRIARFILDNQELVAFSSAADVGAQTGSSAATVVRLCQALNYDGYLHLQADLREGISIQRTAAWKIGWLRLRKAMTCWLGFSPPTSTTLNSPWP
jgi:DNA-binding MurR/RpiR family transcriptional regulator